MSNTPAIDRFITAVAPLGLSPQVQRFGHDTRTAEQAAEAVGCDVAQIVKSLVFKADQELVMVLCSGANRVDTAAAASAFGVAKLGRADAEQCRAATGFAIGGIPPFGHSTALRTVCDPTLLAFETVWAAAGAPDSVFPIAPEVLVSAAKATVAPVATNPSAENPSAENPSAENPSGQNGSTKSETP